MMPGLPVWSADIRRGFSRLLPKKTPRSLLTATPNICEAAKWFTAFTLANNHTDSRGPAGFTETQKHLDENGIQYFGAPDPKRSRKYLRCHVVACESY